MSEEFQNFSDFCVELCHLNFSNANNNNDDDDDVLNLEHLKGYFGYFTVAHEF